MTKTKCLKVGLFNAGSLGTRHDEFVLAMEELAVDLMAINETWLRNREEGRAPLVPNYRLRHIPRPASVRGGRGGGVGFYVRRDLRVRTMAHPIVPDVEQMWLKLTVNSQAVIIGTAYRPPWLNISTFLDAITASLTSFSKVDQTILLGDFNINCLNNNDSGTILLNNFLQYTSLSQVIQQPTHFTDHSETLIDIVCTDAPINNVSVQYKPELGQHAILTVTCLFKVRKPTPQWIHYRPLNNIISDIFQDDLNKLDWPYITTQDHVSDMVTILNMFIITLFDLHAPTTKVLIRERSYPWITDTIKEMVRLRDKYQSRYKLSKSDIHKNCYKDLKSIVARAIDSEKRAFFENYINYNIKYPKKLWYNLKTNINIGKQKSHDLPYSLNDPEELNTHFLNIPGNSTVSSSDLTYFETEKFHTNTFSLVPVSEEVVSLHISSLKSNALGVDNISLEMIRLTLPKSLPYITAIINKSITSSTFPDIWKTAVVRPIPKIPNPALAKDLRPINLLPCLSKVLEKVVASQFRKYLEEYDIIPQKQSGFRQGHSTTTTLLDVVDDILAARDKGMGTLLTLLDYSRAFETINIALLLAKLSYYGCDSATVKWFHSYLTDRSQFVQLDNASDGNKVTSSCCQVNRGAPQGSVLGPLLFLVYSADVTNHIHNTQFHMYADDLQLYVSFHPNDCHESVIGMNADLDLISDWARKNSLVLNPLKSKFLILGSKECIKKIEDLNPIILVDGSPIDRVREARNLGLVMDSELLFETHVLEAAKNCFYRLKVLYRIRQYLSTETRILLCESLILSKLNYGDTVFGPCILKRTQNIIQRVQNACARFCYNIPPRTHVTPFLNSGGLLKMAARRRLHLATLLFGIVKYKRPEYLYRKLSWSRNVNHYSTRAAPHLLVIAKHKTTAFRGSFRYAATHCWNNLPPPIRDLKSMFAFRSKFKRHLVNNNDT